MSIETALEQLAALARQSSRMNPGAYWQYFVKVANGAEVTTGALAHAVASMAAGSRNARAVINGLSSAQKLGVIASEAAAEAKIIAEAIAIGEAASASAAGTVAASSVSSTSGSGTGGSAAGAGGGGSLWATLTSLVSPAVAASAIALAALLAGGIMLVEKSRTNNAIDEELNAYDRQMEMQEQLNDARVQARLEGKAANAASDSKPELCATLPAMFTQYNATLIYHCRVPYGCGERCAPSTSHFPESEGYRNVNNTGKPA